MARKMVYYHVVLDCIKEVKLLDYFLKNGYTYKAIRTVNYL